MSEDAKAKDEAVDAILHSGFSRGLRALNEIDLGIFIDKFNLHQKLRKQRGDKIEPTHRHPLAQAICREFATPQADKGEELEK